jgi:NADH:ubiquinone oxidoreductase subunit F (NADH-binding)/(2Fe-2S) ferredoxin/Pyruvate/2-oxoacid:ferredoxin oxidoreductase delta subunit
MEKLQSSKQLDALKKTILQDETSTLPCIAICSGTGCQAYASDKVTQAFQDQLTKQNLDKKIRIKRTGCHGFCEKGPIVVLYPKEICYLQVKPEDASEIIQTIQTGKIIDRLLYKDKQTGKSSTYESDIPFYKNQTRIIFGNNRKIESENIDDYIALGGYQGLAKALSTMTPDQVLDEVKKANLRGRGGGGFLAGRKWESVKKAPDATKYVIVNCDEGDPGAYMDRSLMEGNPHSVIEGLIIGAYAIGSHEGFIYVRQEYPIAVKNTERAIAQAEEYGLLGKNILGSGFDFTITIHRGAGAFVSGESSALMSAIEGKVGEPRPKYIHTSDKGLWNKPTCLNNVETWANVPFIINNGASWFNQMGTKGSKGTKIFSLVGNVNNTGLVEVPMGISLKEIIYTIGGGVPNGKKLKAIQTGGPSGGCLPADKLDLPVDFDALTDAGSMMGSGGMIVMDEDTCMVDIARYFIQFLADESCGKCIPCREGNRQMLHILNKITSGNATKEDVALLEDLAQVIKASSLCALGQSAPNPVLSTLHYFRDEYDAHLRGECPAKVCKPLIEYTILPEKCKACGLCLKGCPTNAITGQAKNPHIIHTEKCIKCGACIETCRFDAIVKVSSKKKEQIKNINNMR